MHQIKTCNPFQGFGRPAERIKGQPHFVVLIVQAGCKGGHLHQPRVIPALRLRSGLTQAELEAGIHEH